MRKIWAFLIVLPTLLGLSGSATAQIVWDGGNGAWNDANWNGGQAAIDVFGREDGLEIGGTEVSDVVTINSGTVTYDPNNYGDFYFKPGGPGLKGGILNINSGAALEMDSANALDGQWTQFDGEALNLNGGTLRRTFSSPSLSGGALIFGSWRSYEDQEIDINISNGGRIDNSGQVWFGAWGDNAPGIKVNMTINDGHLDLTGGEALPNDPTVGDLIFIHDWDNVANAPKDPEYSINFVGPGSITVDTGGIINAVQDETGDYGFSITNLVSYQDLWNAGILKAHGFSAKKNASFGGFFQTVGNPGDEDYQLISNVKAPTPIVWDGGDGNWTDAKWNAGQTSQQVFGRNNGLEIGSGEIGWDISINSGHVSYTHPNNNDFRVRSGGNININKGATLDIISASDIDGKWTELDLDNLNINGGTLRRSYSDPSATGGLMILGSWRSYEDQVIKVNLTGGGRIENAGILTFGLYEDGAVGLKVEMNINDGHLDLTGGDLYDYLGGGGVGVAGPGSADLLFVQGWDDDTNASKGQEYYINFTGPGSITVDKSGILNPVATSTEGDIATAYGSTLTTLQSYQDLWTKGLLRANGLSGLTGADFAQYFSVAGSVGQDNYKLTSLINNLLPGDVNGDRNVNLVDFQLLRSNFGKNPAVRGEGDLDGNGVINLVDFQILRSNFGNSGAVVPEPSTFGLALLGLGGLFIARRRYC